MRTLGDEPGNHVADLRRGHRTARDVSPPVGSAELRSSDDDRGPQSLVADQGEVGTVGDGAGLRTAPATFAVATGTEGLEHVGAPGGVPRVWRSVGRSGRSVQSVGPRPPAPRAAHQGVYL